MKKSLLLLLVTMPAFAFASAPAFTLTDGKYSSSTCEVAIWRDSGDTIINVKSKTDPTKFDQVRLQPNGKSANGPGLCTDGETVGSQANNVVASIKGLQMTIGCHALLRYKASLVVTADAQGHVTSLTDKGSLGLNLDCQNLK